MLRSLASPGAGAAADDIPIQEPQGPPSGPAAAVALAGLAAIVIALSGCGASHPKPHPPPPARPTVRRATNFGADLSALFFDERSPAVIDRQVAAAASAGLGLARANPLWEATEPRPPRNGVHTYDWRFDDLIASRLAARAFKWIAVLSYAPPWASVDPAHLHGAPRAPADFAAYAAAFAERYRGHIAAYEIWNEENSQAFWRPAPDPAAYARLYLAARDAIHRVDPGIPVLIGGLANGPPFLPPLLGEPGMAGHVDGVAIHPYDKNPLAVPARVRDYRLELRSLGAGDVPLYVTEYGWSTSPPGNSTYATSAQQGPFIGDVASALLRSDCNVRAVVFYAWTTAARNPSDRDQWYGIAPASAAPTAATEAIARAARGIGQSSGSPVRLCGA